MLASSGRAAHSNCPMPLPARMLIAALLPPPRLPLQVWLVDILMGHTLVGVCDDSGEDIACHNSMCHLGLCSSGVDICHVLCLIMCMNRGLMGGSWPGLTASRHASLHMPAWAGCLGGSFKLPVARPVQLRPCLPPPDVHLPNKLACAMNQFVLPHSLHMQCPTTSCTSAKCTPRTQAAADLPGQLEPSLRSC